MVDKWLAYILFSFSVSPDQPKGQLPSLPVQDHPVMFLGIQTGVLKWWFDQNLDIVHSILFIQSVPWLVCKHLKMFLYSALVYLSISGRVFSGQFNERESYFSVKFRSWNSRYNPRSKLHMVIPPYILGHRNSGFTLGGWGSISQDYYEVSWFSLEWSCWIL